VRLPPGNLIACGTSVGVGVMKVPVDTVTVAIDGIGELINAFRQQASAEACRVHF
jgi:2-keto-4-pentenoate hydratase/2-oxohepta-3-ene-1,7-dioic acid hydratase in catechol pathway